MTISAAHLDDAARAGIMRGILALRAWSAAQAAEAVGVSRSTVSRWCQACSCDQLHRLATAAGVTFVRVGEGA